MAKEKAGLCKSVGWFTYTDNVDNPSHIKYSLAKRLIVIYNTESDGYTQIYFDNGVITTNTMEEYTVDTLPIQYKSLVKGFMETKVFKHLIAKG
jgi:hypothetical protein